MRGLRRAGMPSDPVPGGLRFDKIEGPTIGNSLPPNTGVWQPSPSIPGPGLSAGGQIGGNDGFMGADPRYPKRQPDPSSAAVGAWGEGDSSDMGRPTSGRHASFRRFGIQGFNDQLMVRDRHAYWDEGYQRTGIEGFYPAGSPNTYNNPGEVPPTPELRVVNRSVSPQIGSSNSAAQDDLSRNYSRNPQGMYVGEQGSGWSPVYGGVPGLYQPYGTRGGVPYPIVSPVGQGEPGDGPRLVFSGPPHGLHSPTIPDYAQTLGRYQATPQMRPVRADRPSNSPQAGQSYSQTVLAQGAQQARQQAAARVGGYPGSGTGFGTGRGWSGVAK
jgi:hypothetical protein